ncbi:hypothetical protein ACHAW5_003395 [Stephanodiscus triporus]|uniref:Uncharacterized protein n=1 Tax=Stephanodiscus triporus TaxID=2934178 RepID=A0ABD3NRE3_9STRA
MFVSKSQDLIYKNDRFPPTDLETKELAEGMGLTTFYEEKLMASIPKRRLSRYYLLRDHVRQGPICGYGVVQSPLDFFQDESLPHFDMYFQDDGNRQLRFAPYSANSILFRTEQSQDNASVQALSIRCDLLGGWYSHQSILIALLAEHSSVTGSRNGGVSRRSALPSQEGSHEEHLSGHSNAYIFHMSWTAGKGDKLKFLQQLGSGT